LVTINGYLQWQRKDEMAEYILLRSRSDNQPFAGAMVALGQRKERHAYRRFELKKDVDKGAAQPQVGEGWATPGLED
jgi:hypothetical protein